MNGSSASIVLAGSEGSMQPSGGTCRVAPAVAVAIALLVGACGAAIAPASPSGSASAAPATVTPAPATPPGPPATADDWPFFRGNAARTGEGGSGPKGKPVQLWKYQANGSINGAVVIAGNFVYASSDDDMLHALDINTGAEKWHFNPVNAPVSAPAYADGVIYAFDSAGTLFGLDATTGGVRWHAPKPLVGPSGPTVADGTLYVGTGDGAIVAVDVANGAEKWRYTVAPAGGVHNPAVADGIVYAASDSGGLVAVDVATHALVWHWDTGTDITGSVVVAGGIAYVGGTGDSQTGQMSALDAKTGKRLWFRDRPFTAPAVEGGVAYEGDQIGGLEAVDTASGSVLWALPMERAGPSVAAGVVYFGVDTGRLVYALDAASGGELWRFPFDGGNSCCVAVAHGAVFVATQSGSVYKIGGDGSTIQPGPPPPPPASPTTTASIPAATASPSATPTAAQFLWKSTGGTDVMRGPGDVTIAPDGRVWVADTGNGRFAIFDPDGTFVEYWEHLGSGPGEFILQRANGDGYGAMEFAPDGSFYVLDVGNHRVEHFDKDRGFIKAWGSSGTGPAEFADPVGLDVDAKGIVYVFDDVRDVVESYDKDGKVLGTITANPAQPLAGNGNNMTVGEDGNYYVSHCCEAGNQVLELDPIGAPLKTFGANGAGAFLNDQPGAVAIDSDGRVFVAVRAGAEIFGADGTFLGSFSSPDLVGDRGFFSGMALDGAGYGYAAEVGTDQVEKFLLLPPYGSAPSLAP